MQTYLRWRAGEPRTGRVFPALEPDHPAFMEPCIACFAALGNGKPVQLLVVGPGTDAEDLEKHRAGRWYSALAQILHAECLGTNEDHEPGTGQQVV